MSSKFLKKKYNLMVEEFKMAHKLSSALAGYTQNQWRNDVIPRSRIAFHAHEIAFRARGIGWQLGVRNCIKVTLKVIKRRLKVFC
jgi:hypothetical protein